MSNKFPELLSRIPGNNITRLEPFNEISLKELIDDVLSYLPKAEKEKYSLSKEAVSEITGLSEGNARVVAQILDNVFYAVWKEKKADHA